VNGVRFRTDIADSFCCDPPKVIDIKIPSEGYPLSENSWTPGLWGLVQFVEPMVREARSAQGYAHTCGMNDATFSELGPWAAHFYFNLWNALYSGSFLTWTTLSTSVGRFAAYYRDGAAGWASSNGAHYICNAPIADLSLTLDAPSYVVGSGATLTYWITAGNRGPDAAPDVFLYSEVPEGTVLTSTHADSGSCVGPSDGSNGPVGCSLGSLAAGRSTSVQLNFRVTASPPAGLHNSQLTRIGSVGTAIAGTVYDPGPAPNVAHALTSVVDHLPGATTLAPKAIGTRTTTIRGLIDPNAPDASYMFDYGTTTTYDNDTSRRNLATTTSGQIVSERLTDLQPGTTYHYRLVVQNRTRSNMSPDATFRTLSECVVPKMTGKTVASARRASDARTAPSDG
jgi:uncharacterized repeat protein (TIGR01451 family)